MTDRALHYWTLGKEFASRGQLAHERGEFWKLGDFHTNTVWLLFDFRYLSRVALGVDGETYAVKRAHGQRAMAAN